MSNKSKPDPLARIAHLLHEWEKEVLMWACASNRYKAFGAHVMSERCHIRALEVHRCLEQMQAAIGYGMILEGESNGGDANETQEKRQRLQVTHACPGNKTGAGTQPEITS